MNRAEFRGATGLGETARVPPATGHVRRSIRTVYMFEACEVLER